MEETTRSETIYAYASSDVVTTPEPKGRFLELGRRKGLVEQALLRETLPFSHGME